MMNSGTLFHVRRFLPFRTKTASHSSVSEGPMTGATFQMSRVSPEKRWTQRKGCAVVSWLKSDP
jgi:hypothetical protein